MKNMPATSFGPEFSAVGSGPASGAAASDDGGMAAGGAPAAARKKKVQKKAPAEGGEAASGSPGEAAGAAPRKSSLASKRATSLAAKKPRVAPPLALASPDRSPDDVPEEPSAPADDRYLGFFRVKRGDGQHSEVQYFVRDREGRDVLAVVGVDVTGFRNYTYDSSPGFTGAPEPLHCSKLVTVLEWLKRAGASQPIFNAQHPGANKERAKSFAAAINRAKGSHKQLVAAGKAEATGLAGDAPAVAPKVRPIPLSKRGGGGGGGGGIKARKSAPAAVPKAKRPRAAVLPMFDSVRQAFALLPDARRVRNFFLRNSRTGEEVLAAQGVECSPGERRYTFATVPPESRPDLLPVPLADQSAVDEYLERFLKVGGVGPPPAGEDAGEYGDPAADRKRKQAPQRSDPKPAKVRKTPVKDGGAAPGSAKKKKAQGGPTSFDGADDLSPRSAAALLRGGAGGAGGARGPAAAYGGNGGGYGQQQQRQQQYSGGGYGGQPPQQNFNGGGYGGYGQQQQQLYGQQQRHSGGGAGAAYAQQRDDEGQQHNGAGGGMQLALYSEDQQHQQQQRQQGPPAPLPTAAGILRASAAFNAAASLAAVPQPQQQQQHLNGAADRRAGGNGAYNTTTTTNNNGTNGAGGGFHPLSAAAQLGAAPLGLLTNGQQHALSRPLALEPDLQTLQEMVGPHAAAWATATPSLEQVHRFQDFAAALDGTLIPDGADPPEETLPGHGSRSRWIRESEALRVLHEMMGEPVSLELMEASQICRAVGLLQTQRTSPAVAHLAGEVARAWRSLADAVVRALLVSNEEAEGAGGPPPAEDAAARGGFGGGGGQQQQQQQQHQQRWAAPSPPQQQQGYFALSGAPYQQQQQSHGGFGGAMPLAMMGSGGGSSGAGNHNVNNYSNNGSGFGAAPAQLGQLGYPPHQQSRDAAFGGWGAGAFPPGGGSGGGGGGGLRVPVGDNGGVLIFSDAPAAAAPQQQQQQPPPQQELQQNFYTPPPPPPSAGAGEDAGLVTPAIGAAQQDAPAATAGDMPPADAQQQQQQQARASTPLATTATEEATGGRGDSAAAGDAAPSGASPLRPLPTPSLAEERPQGADTAPQQG